MFIIMCPFLPPKSIFIYYIYLNEHRILDMHKLISLRIKYWDVITRPFTNVSSVLAKPPLKLEHENYNIWQKKIDIVTYPCYDIR